MKKVVKTFKGGGKKSRVKKIATRTKKIKSLESNQQKIINNASKIQNQLNKKSTKKAERKASGKKKSFLGRAISRLFGKTTKQLKRQQKNLRTKFSKTSDILNKKRTKQFLETERMEAAKLTGTTTNATRKSPVSPKTLAEETARRASIVEAIAGKVGEPGKLEEPGKLGEPGAPGKGGEPGQPKNLGTSGSTISIGPKTYNLSVENKQKIDNAQKQVTELSSADPSKLSDPAHQAKLKQATTELKNIINIVSKSLTPNNLVAPNKPTAPNSTSLSTPKSDQGVRTLNPILTQNQKLMSQPIALPIAEETSSPKTKQQKAQNLAKTILGKNKVFYKLPNGTELSSTLTTEELRAKVASSQENKAKRQEKRKAAQEKASEKKKLKQSPTLQLQQPRGPPGLPIPNSSNV